MQGKGIMHLDEPKGRREAATPEWRWGGKRLWVPVSARLWSCRSGQLSWASRYSLSLSFLAASSAAPSAASSLDLFTRDFDLFRRVPSPISTCRHVPTYSDLSEPAPSFPLVGVKFCLPSYILADVNVCDFLFVCVWQISKVRVEHCSTYTNCSSCLEARDPYCGWCSLEKRWVHQNLFLAVNWKRRGRMYRVPFSSKVSCRQSS